MNSDILIAFSGLEMNRYSNCICCIHNKSTYKSMLFALSSAAKKIKEGFEKRFGEDAQQWHYEDHNLSLHCYVTRNLRIKFVFKSKVNELESCSLQGFKENSFQILFRYDELSSIEKCLDSICWTPPLELFSTSSCSWVYPKVPDVVQLKGRHVGYKRLVIRAAFFSELRSWISKNIDKQIKQQWIAFLNSLNADKVGVCVSCKGRFPKAKSWQHQCLGCQQKKAPKAVHLESISAYLELNRVKHLFVTK
ncbi:hypothetical protein [Photobacterium damselae]|uniref:hypothetical protein n=1 Tax=Photobacterium damselae TaxID=38293 RepID=UPI00406811C9